MNTSDDIGAMYAAWNELKKATKLSNLEYSTGLLNDLKIPFTSYNNGVHLKVTAQINGEYKIINFWPSTGLWQVQGDKLQTRGVRNLIKLVIDNVD